MILIPISSFRAKREIFVIRGSGTHFFPTCAAHLSTFFNCLSSRQCPIRPFGAPSPRGEGCFYTSRHLDPSTQFSYFQISHFFNTRPFSPLRMTKYAAPPPLNPLNLLNPLNHKPNESKVKRGCEEMRIHFFTAPFLDHLSLTLSAYRRSH